MRAPACGGVAVNSNNTQASSARNSELPPRPESAPCPSLEVSRRGEGLAGFVAVQTDCTYLEHWKPDKRLNGGDVTVMQAPAHPRPEKEAECGERPAPEGATERGRPSPGSRERQAPGPEPSPGPRHPRPGQRLAPRPPRSPSHPARSPLGAGGGPKRRAEWGGRRVPGKGCCLPAPPSPPPPGRAGSGRWAAGEGRSPRVEDRGAEDAAPTPLGRRNFSKPARAGDRGWGKPGALPNSTVGAPPLPLLLCVSPRSAATGGPASFPVPRDGESRFLWPEGMRETGWVPGHSVPRARGAPV